MAMLIDQHETIDSNGFLSNIILRETDSGSECAADDKHLSKKALPPRNSPTLFHVFIDAAVYTAFFLAVRDKMKTLPLWPLVIRMRSSTYPVLSHPRGPKIPRGKV